MLTEKQLIEKFGFSNEEHFLKTTKLFAEANNCNLNRSRYRFVTKLGFASVKSYREELKKATTRIETKDYTGLFYTEQQFEDFLGSSGFEKNSFLRKSKKIFFTKEYILLENYISSSNSDFISVLNAIKKECSYSEFLTEVEILTTANDKYKDIQLYKAKIPYSTIRELGTNIAELINSINEDFVFESHFSDYIDFLSHRLHTGYISNSPEYLDLKRYSPTNEREVTQEEKLDFIDYWSWNRKKDVKANQYFRANLISNYIKKVITE